MLKMTMALASVTCGLILAPGVASAGIGESNAYYCLVTSVDTVENTCPFTVNVVWLDGVVWRGWFLESGASEELPGLPYNMNVFACKGSVKYSNEVPVGCK